MKKLVKLQNIKLEGCENTYFPALGLKNMYFHTPKNILWFHEKFREIKVVTIFYILIWNMEWFYLSEVKNQLFPFILGQKRVKTSEKTSEKLWFSSEARKSRFSRVFSLVFTSFWPKIIGKSWFYTTANKKLSVFQNRTYNVVFFHLCATFRDFFVIFFTFLWFFRSRDICI